MLSVTESEYTYFRALQPFLDYYRISSATEYPVIHATLNSNNCLFDIGA
jgi:hypothetical protein